MLIQGINPDVDPVSAPPTLNASLLTAVDAGAGVSQSAFLSDPSLVPAAPPAGARRLIYAAVALALASWLLTGA